MTKTLLLTALMALPLIAEKPDAPKPPKKQEAPAKPKKPKKPPVPKPTFANVPYDQHERTVLDLWQAPGDGPRPLIVHIHGGGWSQGDKSKGKSGLDKYLDKGISFAAINYRLLTEEITLPTPVYDAARAIQFLRYKAEEWNIDKNRILLVGGSAGGCTSVWLATHNDLANPDSDDPVERESTRVQGISIKGAQTAIDPKLVEPWIGENVYHSMLYLSVGEENIENALANYEKHKPLYHEFSAYYHLTKDDPPMYLGYGKDLTVPAKSIGHGIHHGNFGLKFQEKSEEIGHNQVYVQAGKVHPPEGAEEISDAQFIEKILLGK